MIRMPTTVPAYGAVLVSAFLVSGCAQSTLAERKHYILEAVRPGEPAALQSDATLRFNVDEAFATRQLVYRVEEFRYESDYYHQFLVPPGAMLAELTRDWLADGGLFRRVVTGSDRLESTHLLEANVTALYADFTRTSAPEAILEIRFFLLAGPEAGGSVVLSEAYRAVTPIAARTAEAVVEACSKSLTEILTRLEADVAQVLAGAEGRPPKR
jgi:cholesterol transport system auxiliary component